MIDIYGTIGPSCSQIDILKEMFREGMTGIRINTSHISVKEANPQIEKIKKAASECGIEAKILIDMQGPELRIGALSSSIQLLDKDEIIFISADASAEADGKHKYLPIPGLVIEALEPGVEVLLDDGKILVKIIEKKKNKVGSAEVRAEVIRGGMLSGRKSIALCGVSLKAPAMTAQDLVNIRDAVELGIYGIMQPFVRSAEDLQEVRNALNNAGGKDIKILAKIENMDGVTNLESFFDIADEIVIARGDLGNAMPLWELPRVQKLVSKKCRDRRMPFMLVTQMLASMEHSAVPTRAEVSDIYNAVCDGATSVMVTGETAAGDYPIEVIRYLSKTVGSYTIADGSVE